MACDIAAVIGFVRVRVVGVDAHRVQTVVVVVHPGGTVGVVVYGLSSVVYVKDTVVRPVGQIST